MKKKTTATVASFRKRRAMDPEDMADQMIQCRCTAAEKDRAIAAGEKLKLSLSNVMRCALAEFLERNGC